jgi:hypothetical protein
VNGIAGICSAGRNVVGLMPHPERACEPVLGSADGLVLFESVVSALAAHGGVRRLPHEPIDQRFSNATASPRRVRSHRRRSGASRRSPSSGSSR